MPMNEVDLIKKIVLILIVINFVIGIFYALTNTALAVGNPQNTAINKLNNLGASINSSSNTLVNSFGAQVFTPATSITITNALQTLGVWIINFIYKAILFLVSITVLMGLSFYTIIVMVFEVIPSLFLTGSFGVFNYIATTIYGFTVFIIIVYGGYMILEIYRRIKP